MFPILRRPLGFHALPDSALHTHTRTTKYEFASYAVDTSHTTASVTSLSDLSVPLSPIGRRRRLPRDSNEHVNRGAMLLADRRRLNDELSSVRRRLDEDLRLAMSEELNESEFEECTKEQATHWKAPSGKVFQLPPTVV